MRSILSLAPLLLISCLSYEKYGERVSNKDCTEGRVCSESYQCNFDPAEDLPAAEDCDFDRSAARDCLDAEWTCNTNFTGFEFAVRPTSCEAVCANLVSTLPVAKGI